MIRKLAFLCVRLTGIPFLVRELIQKRRVTIVLYHDLHPEVAEQHLQTLKRSYSVISLREFVQAHQQHQVRKLPAKALIITLDDGFKGNYELLSVLTKHRVPVTIFLCSDIIDTGRHFWWTEAKKGAEPRHLSFLETPDEERLRLLREVDFEETREYPDRQALQRHEIEAMREVSPSVGRGEVSPSVGRGRLVDLQSHTRFHPLLPNCSEQRAWDEISGSKDKLEREYGLDIYALAYPNGAHSERDVALARKAGYECAVTTKVGYNAQCTDPYRLKRLGLTDTADVNELLVKTSGVWGWLRKWIRRPAYE